MLSEGMNEGLGLRKIIYFIYFTKHLCVNRHGKCAGNLNSWGIRVQMSAYGFEESSSVSSTPRFWCLPTLLVPFALAEPLMEFILNMECGGTGLCAWDLCQSNEHRFSEQKNSIWRAKKTNVRDETGLCV